jgi:hypothetical protein
MGELHIYTKEEMNGLTDETLEKHSEEVYAYYDSVIEILNHREEKKIERESCKYCGGKLKEVGRVGLWICKKCGKGQEE